MRHRLVACVVVGVGILSTASIARAQSKPRVAPPAKAMSAADLEGLRKRADEARTSGRLVEAIELYKRAVAQDPSWIEGFWYLGTSYYDTDQAAPCRAAFARVVKAQPGNGAAWAFKGLCEFQLKAYDAALPDLVKAQDVGIGEPAGLVPVARYHRALLFARSGQYEGALQIYSDLGRAGADAETLTEPVGIALLRLPFVPAEVPPAKRDAVIAAGRAGLAALSGRVEVAKQAYEDLVTRYPDVPNVHYAYAGFLLRDHPDDALVQFREELRRSPDHAPAMVQIAQELIKRGDFEGALPFAAGAVKAAPRNFLAHRVLGQVKLAAGDVAGAVTELEAAAALEPSSPSIHYHLARAYQRAGRKSDADRERAEFTRLERQLRVQRGGANAVGEESPPEPPPPNQ
jgi:tetratricopeptide (TPR) repeat protein